MAFTLHNTTEFMKKFGIGSAIGVVGIIVLVVLFNVGIVIKNILFPPKIAPANQAYGPLPPLEFPESEQANTFTYALDTLDGTLPTFPDRIVVYPIINDEPNLLNLQDVRDRVTSIGFVDLNGEPLQEIPRGGPLYEWNETTGLQRNIVYDIVGLDYEMTSQYLQSLTVLNARYLQDEATALATVQGFLEDTKSLQEDINLEKTSNPDPELDYLTKPQLFSITNGQLRPTSSLSTAQVIRVDMYQNDIEYELTAGTSDDLTKFQSFEMDLPIMYPSPPFSTMNFLIASGNSQAQVVEANYAYQKINYTPDEEATYPIKTAEQAFQEIQDGQGYVAAYYGTETQILIREVYLAYFLGKDTQNYMMPVIVFEGPDGFFAYVSAVKDTAIQVEE